MNKKVDPGHKHDCSKKVMYFLKMLRFSIQNNYSEDVLFTSVSQTVLICERLSV